MLSGVFNAQLAVKLVTTLMISTFGICIVASMSKESGSWFKYEPVLYLVIISLVVCTSIFICSKDLRGRFPETLQNGAFIGQLIMMGAVAADLQLISVLTAIGVTALAGYCFYIFSQRVSSQLVKEYLLSNVDRAKVIAPVITLTMTVVTIAFYAYQASFKDAVVVFTISCVMLAVSAAYLVFIYLPFFA